MTTDPLVTAYYQRLLNTPLDDYWQQRIAQGRLTWEDYRRGCWETAVYTIEEAWRLDGEPA